MYVDFVRFFQLIEIYFVYRSVESGRLVKDFSELVKSWIIPKSQNSQLIEKWTRFQQVSILILLKL